MVKKIADEQISVALRKLRPATSPCEAAAATGELTK
jgi:hypothetical protein